MSKTTKYLLVGGAVLLVLYLIFRSSKARAAAVGSAVPGSNAGVGKDQPPEGEVQFGEPKLTPNPTVGPFAGSDASGYGFVGDSAS